MQERALIASIRHMAGHGPSALRVSIGDDCAVWRPGTGREIIVTTDQLAEGVHYPAANAPARLLGARLVGRGLSDIAAMGGEPRLAFLNVAWPTALPERWCLDFLRGFAAETRRWKTAWAGGDVSSISGPAVASITVIGEVPAGQALLRSGARPGDLLYVSGRLGAAALRNMRRITPRLALGQALRGRATACMDLSDGLSTDLHHLCKESGVGAVVEAPRIPVASTLDRALNWGEDYELLFTARPNTRIPTRLADVTITCIGRCTRRASGVRIEDADGRCGPLEPRGWQHLG
jgi:thiamine-monophosphate kinase